MKACKSILVTDDNDDVRELIMDALTNEGYHVTGARDGVEALTKLHETKVPTLVLLDLFMPTLNGWDLWNVIKGDDRLAAHSVVTVSSVNSKSSPTRSPPMDTAGRINKPVNWNLLWDTVNKFCETPKPNKEPQFV